MSLDASKLVWQHSKATGSALVILLALADHANEAFEAWPSVSTLAQRAKLTDRGVQKLLRRLEADGEITPVRTGPRGVTVYRITCGTSEPLFTPEQAFTPEQTFTPTPEQVFTPPPNRRSPEPSRNHQGTIIDGVDGLGIGSANGIGASASPPGHLHPSAASGSQPHRAGAASRRKVGPAVEIDAAFAEFKDRYPSRAPHANPVKPAREAFAAAVRRGADPEAIIRGAENYAMAVDQQGTDPRYVAQAKTWLHQERWTEYQRRPDPVRRDDGLC